MAHRDVKPTNILLTESGHCALSDFGLATRLRGGLKTFCGACVLAERERAEIAWELTYSHAKGTAEYIAPEVLSEKMWSASYLDMWAFGITLYQLVTGKTPFEA